MEVIARDITKRFGTQVVLSKLNLKIKDKETICLMGPSGSGKTTLLFILAGRIAPEEGQIIRNGKGRISMVFQENRLIEGRDAFTNLSIVLKRKPTLEQMRKEYARVCLTDYENKPVSEFSGGMKRRVAIVRAVCADADLLLMDEPYKGLDEEIKERVIRYVKERAAGRTVVMTSHDRQEAGRMGARIVELQKLQER